MEITPAQRSQILELYNRGQCLQAYEIARQLGPLKDWEPTPARVLAGRLAMNLGAPRLGTCLHLRARRLDPQDPEADYFFARALLERRGPLAVWKYLKRGPLPGATPAVRADWLALSASVAGLFRDFDTAETLLAQALAIAPDRPWIFIEQAALLELEDRYEEALAAARQALTLRPWYRPAVQSTAHALQLLDRTAEALELMTEADRRIENGPLVLQLAALQIELGHYHDARRSYERFVELSPLIEKKLRDWVAARRSDTAYYAGDHAAAAEWARNVPEPYYEKLAGRLTAPEGGRRVVLPVGFVRQHYQTCAPATLVTLARFWEMSAEHLEVAGTICYDGTPAHSERHWAEEHGWAVREFTVTWESAVALIARGVPFTLTTSDPGNAHLQAVIGYDTLRQTLVIRDPSQRIFSEFIAETTLAPFRSTGPRGMALVPKEKASLLADLDLPDSALYDQLYQVQRALVGHDRERAEECVKALEALAPGHRLALQGRRCLASYDASPTDLLACTEGLLKLYPDDMLLHLGRLALLRDLAPRAERLAEWQRLCARKDADPICWLQYAQELEPDARQHAQVRRLLRRAIRFRPLYARNYFALAGHLWDRREFAESLELYRIAACLEDKDEQLAQAYFIASRHLKEIETVLKFLQNRFQRFGRKSSQPARTLFWALGCLEQSPRGFEVLEEALRLRPDDGDLLLHAAESWGTFGNIDRAGALLEAARGHSARLAWLRTAANLASYRGDLPRALALWREVVEAEPLAMDARRAMTLLLAETESRAAALAHLQQACDRFPHHYPLHQLWIEWLRGEGAWAVEPVVRRILTIHPTDAWAHRELALTLASLNRLDEAFAALEAAGQLEPASASYHCIRGRLCRLAGKKDEAKAALREALRLSADFEVAIGELMNLCDTLAERRAELAFIEGEFVRQVIFGDGLLAFREHAQYTLEPDELLASLRRALEARPDLWHTWSAVVRQLTVMERLDEARDLALQATARFPLLPRLWLDLALVEKARQNPEGQIEALHKALQINPGWGTAARLLAEALERRGANQEAKALLEQAVRRTPLDVLNHGCLADVLWKLGEKEPALERVQHALRLDPGYAWAWDALRAWSDQVGKPELALALARDLTERRAGEARSWLMLARMLHRPEDLEERLAALDRAIALSPRNQELYDLRAESLAGAGRFEEALAACRPEVFGPQPPLILRGRAAWLEARRGHEDEAVRQMEALLVEDPAYYWGWEQLAQWFRKNGREADYLRAATNLVRLEPNNPVALSYLGEARLRNQDRPGGKAALTRALAIEPASAFAAFRLFDEQMADAELEGAAGTLQLLRVHLPGEGTLLREIELASREGDRDLALARLGELCRLPQAAEDSLRWAHGALQASWSRQAEEVLCKALEEGNAHSLVGALWVQSWVSPVGGRGRWVYHSRLGALWVQSWGKRKDWRSQAARLDALASKGEAGLRAVVTYARTLGKSKKRGLLRRLINRHRDLLRANTLAWGQIGSALGSADDDRQAAEWMADWPQLADAQPWMLVNLAISLRAVGRTEEAARVHRHALTLERDYTSVFHRLWLVVDEVLAGDPAAADHLVRIDPKELDPYHAMVAVLAGGLLRIREADVSRRSAVFAEVRRQLAETARQSKAVVHDTCLRRTYRRFVREIGRCRGGLVGWAWGLWRCCEPILPPREKKED